MKCILLILGMALSSTVWAGIGTVTENKGTVCEIQRNKNKLSGVKGADVESMDLYNTGACSASITFKDDTKVKVTENSRLLIDDFVFDPKKSDAGKLTMKVAMGTVRYASGQIAKNNPQQVAINTPTATVAVRGTDFNMTVDESGRSLVILVPSCKDELEQKKYELDEQRCRVGKITVSNLAGSVTLDQAFEGTFVTSTNIIPTPPVVMNIVEGKINNNLIIVKPVEIQHAIKEQNKTKQDRENEELEAEATRRLAQIVKDSAPAEEKQPLLPYTFADGRPGCNPSTSICVRWENPDQGDIQSKGKGTAFRDNQPDHYAEVKTTGYSSNTTITIIQNDSLASTVIGSGDPGGNIVTIKQNNGVLRPR